MAQTIVLLVKLHYEIEHNFVYNFFLLGGRVWVWFRVKPKERRFHALAVICHKFIHNSIIFLFQGNSDRHVVDIFMTLVFI